jgi:type VI secretion system secreted protein VgrG
VSILIAQAALESGWGRHVKDNAYFGIKSHNTTGSTTSFATTEFLNGKKVSTSDTFRAYKDFNEAALDYGNFLTSNKRYKDAFSYKNNPEKFADKLQSAGYATDPQYAKKLKLIISKYNLNEYDN